MSKTRGSEWRKWDLHVHTPKSIYHQYGPDNETTWENYIKDLESLDSNFSVLGINDYLFLDGYERLKFEKENNNINLVKEINQVNQINENINKLIRKNNNINKFNLGKIKYNTTKNKLFEEIRKHINFAVKEVIHKEKIKEQVCEDLTFQVKYDKKKKPRSKKVKNKLSGFVKGYLQERIDYISSLNEVIVTKENAAYTSQTCSNPDCQCFGERHGDMFHCPNCGRVVYSGHESAKITLSRKYDTEITLKMSPFKVKKILEGRSKKRLIDKKVDIDINVNEAIINRINQDLDLSEMINKERNIKKSA